MTQFFLTNMKWRQWVVHYPCKQLHNAKLSRITTLFNFSARCHLHLLSMKLFYSSIVFWSTIVDFIDQKYAFYSSSNNMLPPPYPCNCLVTIKMNLSVDAIYRLYWCLFFPYKHPTYFTSSINIHSICKGLILWFIRTKHMPQESIVL